jgi:hypothetical protein
MRVIKQFEKDRLKEIRFCEKNFVDVYFKTRYYARVQSVRNHGKIDTMIATIFER